MTMTELFVGIIGVLLGIVSFFLIRTMSKLDNTHDTAHQNKMDIALLKQKSELNYEHISEKLDDITKGISDIKNEMKKP